MNIFDLTGKVAIVTGGAGWLGSAISESLAEAGAMVAVVDNNDSYLKNLVADFHKKNFKVEGFNRDVMKEEPLRKCIDEIAKKFSRLDILVNCAYTGPNPEIDKACFEDFNQGFNNGATSYAIASQQAVRHMKKIGGGNIINIGSMYGIVTGYPEVYDGLTSPNSIVYQASKASVIHMTKYMAVYWAKDNIRVNCISPGPFLQRDIPQKMPEFAKRISKKVPMGRFGQANEIKGAVLLLASDASSYITGHNLVVDGGWTAW